MAVLEDEDLKDALEEALWQVEEAKRLSLSITRSMNFINLSREAQGYGNKRLAIGLLNKARESLFNDLVQYSMENSGGDTDAISQMKLERTIKDAREIFMKGSAKKAYEILLSVVKEDGECGPVSEEPCDDDGEVKLYSEALDSLQKVWLKMKQEEKRGKDMSKAQKLVREAKALLSRGNYDQVLALCKDVSDAILSPQDRLKEEVEEAMEEITRTMRGLFPEGPRSPKERFFKKQIEELMAQSQSHLRSGRSVEAVNSSRKAREILQRLEQESIKGDIPRMIIELRADIDEIRTRGGDVSYEEYLLRQIEETFWKGEYIQARKTANKLLTVSKRAKENILVNDLSSRFTDLSRKLKENTGSEGYLQAREFLEKAKLLMEESAYDMAETFLEKANSVLNG